MTTRKRQLICLLILAALQGCGATGPTENSARSRIGAELKKWVAGQDSEVSTFEARLNLHNAPISYSIRTIVPAEPKLPIDVMAKYPDAIGKDVPAFRVIVDVDFKSKAGTPLTKVVEYNVTWVNEMNDWAIREKY